MKYIVFVAVLLLSVPALARSGGSMGGGFGRSTPAASKPAVRTPTLFRATPSSYYRTPVATPVRPWSSSRGLSFPASPPARQTVVHHVHHDNTANWVTAGVLAGAVVAASAAAHDRQTYNPSPQYVPAPYTAPYQHPVPTTSGAGDGFLSLAFFVCALCVFGGVWFVMQRMR